MIAAALLILCGFVRTTGSAGDQHLVLAAEGVDHVLYGKAADDLTGWPGQVCVRYDADQPRLPGNAIAVRGFRLRGDGVHEPIAGRIVQRRTSHFEIRTDDGKRFSIRGDALELRPFVERHVWLTARWHDGALEPIRIGLLGTQSN